MAKKAYKFKLEALLKVREFKEKKIKIELGEINKEIYDKKFLIEKLNKEIDQAYLSHELTVESEVDARTARFFPVFIKAKRGHIKQSEIELIEIQKRYQLKLRELNQARGETKVIEKMKEKDFLKYRKEMTKKETQEIEEMFLITRGHQKKGAL